MPDVRHKTPEIATAPEAKLDLTTLRSIPHSIWALGFVSLLMDISSEMIHALLPIYLITVLGASALTIGFIEGVAEATSAMVKVFSGAISDWLGRRKAIVVAGYTLSALTKPIFPMAASVDWLLAARFVDRVGKGIRGAPRDALMADIAPAHLRGAAFGLRQSLDTIGAVAGPALAIFLMWLTSNAFTAVFWLAVIPAGLCVALLVLGVEEPEQAQTPNAEKPRFGLSDLQRLSRPYWLIVALGAVFALARFSEAFLLLRAQAAGLPVALIPMVLIVMNVVYALSAYPAGVLSDNGDRIKPLALGLVCLVAADVLLALGSNLLFVALGVALWGLHLGLTQGLLAALVADRAPADLRGTAYGVFNLVTGVALLLASIIAGALWDGAGPKSTFLCGAVFASIALAGLVFVRWSKPETQT
jgi:MFS family permease